jgi:hypothetical protein
MLPDLSGRIIRAVGEEVPEYERPMEGRFGRNVRLGVERALERFVAVIEGSAPEADEDWREVYLQLGRGEVREGRTLDALLSAYRVGARHAWREVVSTGRAADLPDDALYLLGEAIFAYIDELSAASAEGYAAEQSSRAGERQRRRRALVALFVQSPPAEAAAIQEAARAAEWRVPAEVAVVAAATEDAERLAGRIGPDAIARGGDGLATIVLGDPRAPGLAERLAQALDCPAAIGPATAPADAATSADWARRALELVEEGVLPGDAPAIAEQHLPALLLHRDEALLGAIRRRALAPLDELPEGKRARLVETLSAWLDHQGRMDPTAHDLGVHPQTVRYRLGRLRDLLGDALDSAEGRLLLTIATEAEKGPKAPPV